MNAPLVQTKPYPARFTVDEFLRIDETGVFDRYSKSELIEGEIICMNAQHSRHARVKSLLLVELANGLRALDSDLEAWSEVSVRLSDTSLPEPDIVLTSYRGAGPVPAETVALIVEVADTTLDIDLGLKADLYSAAGVPEYWVIDLTEGRALLHEHPSPDGYEGQLDILLGEYLRAASIAGLTARTEKLV